MLKKRNRRAIAIVVTLFMIMSQLLSTIPAAAAGADYVVDTDITADTTWISGNTYIICKKDDNSSPVIKPGVTLTIENGVTIKLSSGSEPVQIGGITETLAGNLEVQGNIVANNATFTAYNVDGAWNSVFLRPVTEGSQVSGTFTDCTFEKGGGGGSIYAMLMAVPDSAPTAADIALSVSNCVFKDAVIENWGSGNGQKGGIYYENNKATAASHITVQNSQFVNLGGGINVGSANQNVDISITNSSFSNLAKEPRNNYAVNISSGRDVTVSGCSFSNNGGSNTGAYSGDLLLCENGSVYPKAITLKNNTFTGGGGYTGAYFPLMVSAGSKINESISSCGNTFSGYPATVNVSAYVIGQGSVSGKDIDAVWGDIGIPYWVDHTICAGYSGTGSLSVKPGAHIRLANNPTAQPSATAGQILVYGSFNVEGTSSAPVKLDFDPSGTRQEYNRVNISNASGNVTLQHCMMDGLYYGIYGNSTPAKTISNFKIENCILRNMLSDGICLLRVSGLQMKETLIYGNAGRGALIKDCAVSPQILNCAIANNSGKGAELTGSTNYSGYQGPIIKNSIFYGNTDTDLYLNSYIQTTASITYSCVGTKTAEALLGAGCLLLNTNPLFTNPTVGDFTLQSTSPCKNAGENGVDIGYIPGEAEGGDSTAPSISAITPNGTNASVSGSITVTFSEPMNSVAGAVYLSSDAGTSYGPALTGGSWSVPQEVYSIPYSGLAYNTAYQIKIEGFRDASGNVMTADTGHSFTTLSEAQQNRVTVTFMNGDSIYASKTVIQGNSLGDDFPSAPSRSTYTFAGWYADASGSGTQFTSGTLVNANITLYAKWSYNGGGSSGNTSGGGTGGTSSNNTSKETAVTGSTATATATASVGGRGIAAAAFTQAQISDAVSKALEASEKLGDAARVEIKVEAALNASSVETTIPQKSIQELTKNGIASVTFINPVASIMFDANALSAISDAATGAVIISSTKVDASMLADDARKTVGERPVFDFRVTSGGNTISKFDGNVTVSVPYSLKPAENANSVVIFFINESGRLETMANCRYDSATGCVIFHTTHFSKYAVGYNEVSFKDVASNTWYSEAIGFIAARGITTGTGNGNYSPEAKLTRGEFIVMMMRAYGIEPDTVLTGNFLDAGNTYYTGYLAAAKRLGISNGVGNNMFAPEKQITRQEMFTLLYNTLKAIGKLPKGTSGKTLSDFSDADQIASWAKEAMTLLVETGTIGGNGGKLTLTDTSTRAQMAQVLYNLLAN